MNIWHDIDKDRIYPTDFISVIEISKGSNMKYELDKKTGMLPRTYADDKDPLDVLLLCSEPIQPLSLVRSYPIGVMSMEDGGMGDEKIIAIPYGDPTYMSYTSVQELPDHIFEELKHFFSVYKQLEGKKILADLLKLLPAFRKQWITTPKNLKTINNNRKEFLN